MDPHPGAAAAVSPPPVGPDATILKDYKYEIKCAECNKIYTDTVLYQKHYVELHLRLDIVYTCPLCYENFDDHSRYLGHYRGHFARDEFESGKYAKNLSSKKKKFNKNKIYSCDQCKKSFSTLRGFKMHIAGHHSDIKYTYACKECGKVLNSQNGLTVHLESHKFGRHIMCDLCGTRFSQKINWKIHMKRYHEEKLFACKTCEKTFPSPAALKTHAASHSDRKYICKICDKGFKTERYMKIHFSQHNAVKSRICEICDKGFFNLSKLKQHLNTHTGEKPFKCQFCPSGFTNFSNRLKHVRRMHKKETDPSQKSDSEHVRASDAIDQDTVNKLLNLQTDENNTGNFTREVALSSDELLEELELSISYIREQMNGCDAISIKDENDTSIGAVVPTDICDTGDYNRESSYNCNIACDTTSEETNHSLHQLDLTMINNNVNCYNRGEITTTTNAVLPNTQPLINTIDDTLTDVNNLSTSYASTSQLLYINNNYALSNPRTNSGIGIHHFNAANVVDYPVQMSSNSYIILLDSSAGIGGTDGFATIGPTVDRNKNMFVVIPNGVRLQQSSLLSANEM